MNESLPFFFIFLREASQSCCYFGLTMRCYGRCCNGCLFLSPLSWVHLGASGLLRPSASDGRGKQYFRLPVWRPKARRARRQENTDGGTGGWLGSRGATSPGPRPQGGIIGARPPLRPQSVTSWRLLTKHRKGSLMSSRPATQGRWANRLVLVLKLAHSRGSD